MKHVSQMIAAIVCATGIFTVTASSDEITDENFDKRPGNILAKVDTLLEQLAAKIKNESAEEAVQNEKYTKWCDDVNETSTRELKQNEIIYDDKQAAINLKKAELDDLKDKIDGLIADISQKQTDEQDAKDRRLKEAADYRYDKKTLEDAVKNIGNAKVIIADEMEKHPAALLQMDNNKMKLLINTMSNVVDAISLQTYDKTKLTALIQSASAGATENYDGVEMNYRSLAQREEGVAPKVYKSSSASIYTMLEDLEDKAQSQLYEIKEKEIQAKAAHQHYLMDVENELNQLEQTLNSTKTDKHGALEELGVLQGESLKVEANLALLLKKLKELKADCSKWDADYVQYLLDTQNELKAIEGARSAILTAIGHVGNGIVGVDGLKPGTYTSFFQTEALQTSGYNHMRHAQQKVVDFVRRWAKKHHSKILTQLASKMHMILKYQPDEFYRVKNMIKNLLAKLEATVSKMQTEGKYCDMELLKTNTTLTDLGIDIQKLDLEIENSYSREIDLSDKEKDTRDNMKADLWANRQLNKWYNEMNRIHVLAEQELKNGLEAVRKAIDSLEEFYGASENKGGVALMQAAVQSEGEVQKGKQTAGQTIIGMLELVENDLAAGLSQEGRAYAANKLRYEEEDEAFKITYAGEEKEVLYYGSEYLDASRYTGQMNDTMKETMKRQFDVIAYYIKLKERCSAKAEQFADRKRERDQEIEGLKEAKRVMAEETANAVAVTELAQRNSNGATRALHEEVQEVSFLQKSNKVKVHRSLRGLTGERLLYRW